MAPKEHNRKQEMEMRRDARAARRAKAEKERRALLFRLGAVVVIAILAALLIIHVASGAPEETTPITTEPPAPQTSETGNTEGTQGAAQQSGSTVIHIAAAGDLNVTDTVLENATTEFGYDFSQTFLDVGALLSGADLTLLNFEGNLSGPDYGTKTGSAPMELAQTLKNMGVDYVQTANSATIRNGVLGLQATLDALDQVGIGALGTFRDSSAFRKSGGYTIVEVQGIRIALVAFTKGMDNLGLPEGSEDCVNLLYEDYSTDYKEVNKSGINDILERIAEEQVDITIAMVHWGSEYNEEISSTQKTIRNLLLSGGVDVILGTHPHLVQSIEYDSIGHTLVAYSLGDFFGDAAMGGSNYSIVLDLEITKDQSSGEVYLSGYSYTPLYILQPEQSAAGRHRVVRIVEAMGRYESSFVGAVTEDTYDSMAYALERIGKRIATVVE